MSLPTADDFWRWAGRLYAAPGHAAACLNLQDRFGANVNLILLLCWLDQQPWHLPGDTLEPLYAAPALADAELESLRDLRRRLKGRLDPADYRRLQAVELALERQQQAALLAAAAHCPPVPGRQPHHLRHYLQWLGVPAAQRAILTLDGQRI